MACMAALFSCVCLPQASRSLLPRALLSGCPSHCCCCCCCCSSSSKPSSKGTTHHGFYRGPIRAHGIRLPTTRCKVAVAANAGAGARAARTMTKAVMRTRLAAAAFHSTGGSVDRNDAASTGPLFRPNSKLSLEEAVRLQMQALAHNDDPRLDHGLEVMYNFANTDSGDSGSTLTRYFGFPSDLYHFGHFAFKFKTRYPELLNHLGYEIVRIEESKEEAGKGTFTSVTCEVRLKTKSDEKISSWVFTMSKHSRGQESPCWLTTSLQRAQ